MGGSGPWGDMVAILAAAISGPIARGLSLVAVVIGGLMMAFDGTDNKRMLGGLIFGVAMAIGAGNFLIWLFS